MKTVYLFHGILNDNGKNSTDKLRPYLERAGFHVIEADYGEVAPTNTRVTNKALARIIAGMAEVDSYAIGHSNGCALIHLATHQGAHFKKVVYINPALKPDLVPSKLVEQVYIYHSRDDHAVDFARIAIGEVGGIMGRIGYYSATEIDSRVENIDLNKIFAQETLEQAHSCAFSEKYIAELVQNVISDLLF